MTASPELAPRTKAVAEDDYPATGELNIQPATDAETPDESRAYSKEVIGGKVVNVYGRYFDFMSPAEQHDHKYVLNRNDTGEAVIYDPNSEEFIHRNSHSGESSLISQELTFQDGELPDDIAQSINQAESFEEAIAVLHDNDDTNPMVQVAILSRIAKKFHSEDQTGKIDKLVVESVKHATEDSKTSPDAIIESMVYAVDVASPEAKSEVIDTLKDALQTIDADPYVVEAVSSALDDLPEQETSSGSFRAFVEEHAERQQLEDEMQQLSARMAMVEQRLSQVNDNIEQQAHPKKNSLPGVRGLLSGLIKKR